MRLKFVCIIAVMFIFGCNGPRVVNNTYDAVGASYVLNDEMVYVGEVPSLFNNICDGLNCTSLNRVNSRLVEDFFVRVEDGKVVEFAILAFEKLTGPYHFLPGKSEKVVFGGREFGEGYGSFETSSVADPYSRLIAEAGYDSDGSEYYYRDLWRNTSRKTRQILRYGCSANLMSKSVGMDEETIRTFLRERMSSRIVSPGS